MAAPMATRARLGRSKTPARRARHHGLNGAAPRRHRAAPPSQTIRRLEQGLVVGLLVTIGRRRALKHFIGRPPDVSTPKPSLSRPVISNPPRSICHHRRPNTGEPTKAWWLFVPGLANRWDGQPGDVPTLVSCVERLPSEGMGNRVDAAGRMIAHAEPRHATPQKNP